MLVFLHTFYSPLTFLNEMEKYYTGNRNIYIIYKQSTHAQTWTFLRRIWIFIRYDLINCIIFGIWAFYAFNTIFIWHLIESCHKFSQEFMHKFVWRLPRPVQLFTYRSTDWTVPYFLSMECTGYRLFEHILVGVKQTQLNALNLWFIIVISLTWRWVLGMYSKRRQSVHSVH